MRGERREEKRRSAANITPFKRHKTPPHSLCSSQEAGADTAVLLSAAYPHREPCRQVQELASSRARPFHGDLAGGEERSGEERSEELIRRRAYGLFTCNADTFIAAISNVINTHLFASRYARRSSPPRTGK